MPTTLFIALALARLAAQTSSPPHESRLHAEFRLEAEHLRSSCSGPVFKALAGCVVAAATEHPVHVALGSIAPQNGFGVGAAFTDDVITPNWRTSWNADGVRAWGGAWRSGLYWTGVRTAVSVPTLAGPNSSGSSAVESFSVIRAYAQAISLPTILYYGEGRDTASAGKSAFALREQVTGVAAVVPVRHTTAVAIRFEADGRFVQAGAPAGTDVPSTFALYAPAGPALAPTARTLDFAEGIRLTPSLGGVAATYAVDLHEFVGIAGAAFRRWTVDLDHEIPIVHSSRAMPAPMNGPDQCGKDASDRSCPAVSRDRWGAISVRAVWMQSQAGGANVVPIYFQPTLGGTDINGMATLSTYGDYRFRGPNLFLLREGIDCSVWGPLGATLAAEQGTVSALHRSLDVRRADHGYTAGLTLRAGGFPAASLQYAWGGREGSRVVFTMSTGLLGGGSRPSLF